MVIDPLNPPDEPAVTVVSTRPVAEFRWMATCSPLAKFAPVRASGLPTLIVCGDSESAGDGGAGTPLPAISTFVDTDAGPPPPESSVTTSVAEAVPVVVGWYTTLTRHEPPEGTG